MELSWPTRLLIWLLSKRPDVGNIDLTLYQEQETTVYSQALESDRFLFEGEGDPTPAELDAIHLEFCLSLPSDD